ncbi:MAG: GerMN domain-containing protein [Desulfobacterales bacterium]
MMAKHISLKVAAVVSAIIVFGGIGYFLFIHLSEWSASDTRQIPIGRDFPPAVEDGRQTKSSPVYLYFADEKGSFLVAEKRMLLQNEDPAAMGRAIIDDLIRGPREKLVRTIPEGTSLNAMYVSHDGTAFADFSDALRENHPGGSQTELLTVYSIVNSLVLNIPQINSIKILIKGRETITIAGHIDSRSPFKANMILVR